MKNNEFDRYFNEVFSNAFKKGFKLSNSDFDIDPDIFNSMMNIKSPDFKFNKEIESEIDRLAESLAKVFINSIGDKPKYETNKNLKESKFNREKEEVKKEEKINNVPKKKISEIKSTFNKVNDTKTKESVNDIKKPETKSYDELNSINDYLKKLRKEKELKNYINIGVDDYVLFDTADNIISVPRQYTKTYIGIQTIESIKSVDSGKGTQIRTVSGKEYFIESPIEKVIEKFDKELKKDF